MSSYQTAKRIAELALDKKGQQIVLMDISDISGFADYFVIISGDSNVQIKAIADHIEDQLRSEKIRTNHKEGYQYQNWVLLDYIDVVVHIFKKQAREYYGIEQLWADAKIEFISDTTA